MTDTRVTSREDGRNLSGLEPSAMAVAAESREETGTHTNAPSSAAHISF